MSKIPKIICGIIIAILISVVGYSKLPTVWFWIGFEILAALLVAAGCLGELYLFHHPAGRRRREKDQHHALESRFILSVAIGVTMELFALSHAIPEAVKLERDVSAANERAGSNEVHFAELNSSNLVLQSTLDETKIELGNTEIRLAKIKNAIPPRQIPEKQRELFIATLLQTNAFSSPKIDIKVFVPDVDDPEVKNFADFIRKMLNDAGYGTNGEDVIKIQPLNVAGGKNERMPEVFAVFAADNNGNKIPLSMPTMGGSLMPFYPTKATVQTELTNSQIPIANYYSNNPNDILGGVRNILNYIGVSTTELFGTSILKPYEVGLYIPQQFQ